MKQLFLMAVRILSTLLFLQDAKAQFNNTKYGVGALSANTTGYSNTAIGSSTLFNNTTGNNNTANGSDALFFNTTGTYNTATGQGALQSNTTANSNTATGVQALHKNTTGYLNTADGVNALYSNTTGYYNTASGVYALYANTTGFNNTATGYQALYKNTSGIYNTALGNYALQNNTTGARNTAVGDSAGARYSYNYSTFVGYKTTTSVSGLTNVTVIGNGASATASNQVRIGNTSVTSIGGKVGWTTLSDGRFKKNIKGDVPGLSFITQLKPVTYTLDIEAIDKASGVTEQLSAEQGIAKAAAAKEKHTGFVAQEVQKAATDLNYDFGGVDKPKNDKDFYGLRYAEFVVPLVKAVQEQQKQIEQQQQQIDELKALVTKLANGQSVTTNTLSSAYLEQNNPNPVSGNTTIRYHIPTTAGSAKINLTDSKGQLVKTIAISNKGAGQVRLDTNMLASGSYNYTLYVDGMQSDTKRLIIVR